MSVYIKEKPEYLKLSISSIFNQTLQTDDFVLVCDGPLNNKLDEVIGEAYNLHSNIMKIIRLPENVGLGRALNIGIKYCKKRDAMQSCKAPLSFYTLRIISCGYSASMSR